VLGPEVQTWLNDIAKLNPNRANNRGAIGCKLD